MIVDTLDIFQYAVTAGLLTFSINLRAFIRLVKPQKKLTESGCFPLVLIKYTPYFMVSVSPLQVSDR